MSRKRKPGRPVKKEEAKPKKVSVPDDIKDIELLEGLEDSDMDVSMVSVPALDDTGLPTLDSFLDNTLTEPDFPNITAMEASYRGDSIKHKVRVNFVEVNITISTIFIFQDMKHEGIPVEYKVRMITDELIITRFINLHFLRF